MKQGLPWTGLVKNRRKNGDYYWVIANATPLIESGKVVGYLSVRTKPARDVIEKTIPIYRLFLEGKARNLKIEHGQVKRTDVIGRMLDFFKPTIAKRIGTGIGLSALALLTTGSIGWWALAQNPSTAVQSNIVVGATIAGLLLLAYFAASMARNILSPLKQASQMANTLAAGDLTGKFAINRSDEFGELLKALAQMGVNLRATVLDVQRNALTVRQASGEIAEGNLDLSQRTEEQASSLEETASSMEQLTSTVRQNTDNSINANQLAVKARDVTAKGGDMMKTVVSTMSSISESSNKIADIITVIDGIAFQTNILALNAAVEAARAGEQGRGFAVVATEVRSLAQRSATAAKEIKALIDDSVLKVNEGTELVNQAGQTMDEIVASIKHVTEIMSDITAASREQSTGIEQVNQAITQMDEVTQQNAALVEEAAAAASSLEQQADELVGAISIFNVSKNGAERSADIVRLSDRKDTRRIEANEIDNSPTHGTKKERRMIG